MKLNRVLTTIIMGAAVGLGMNAQQTAGVEAGVADLQVSETVLKEFRPHWYLQLQGGIGETVGETSVKDLISPAAAINVGYKFNPLWGIRFGGSGWQAKGHWVYPSKDYQFKYGQFNVDATLSLTNLFCGFKADRVLDFYAALGAGACIGFDNDEAVAIDREGYHLLNLWTGKKFFAVGRGALGVNFNLSNSFALNLEVNANMLPDKFNSKKGSDIDWQFNAFVGVAYHFGGRSKSVPVVVEPIAEEVVVYEPEPEPEPVVKEEPKPVVEKPAPVAPMQQDVFFLINSSKIRATEMAKVDEIAEYMKAHPSLKVTVTGYADKATGSSAFNMQISERRAQAVADALVAKGIDASRIAVTAKGDTVQPFSKNKENRVAIALAEE